MMRIDTDQTQDHLILRVAGRLCGDSVAALEECWEMGRQSLAGEQAVDVSEVTCIDRIGWRLLRRMHRDGVKFSARGFAGQTIVDQLADTDELTDKKESCS